MDAKLPVQAPGDAVKGKESFETRGCLACHSVGEGENFMGGTFAANRRAWERRTITIFWFAGLTIPANGHGLTVPSKSAI